MAGTFQPQQNHILDALPQPERERLFPYLKLVALPLGKVLYESGDTLRHIYFPTDSIVSLLYVLKDGASAEIAVVGNDGAIGVALFMGGETTTNRAIVQSAGSAYMLTGARLKEEFGRHGEMLHILLPTALHAGVNHPNDPDRGLQPASFRGPATVPLVVVVA
jgi:CRP-like cAMP-binding protein